MYCRRGIRHVDNIYKVTINGNEKEVFVTDGKLDYKAYIAKQKEKLGSDAKVWIKFSHKEYWTEIPEVRLSFR